MSDSEILQMTTNQQRITKEAFAKFEDLTFDFAMKCGTLIILYVWFMVVA